MTHRKLDRLPAIQRTITTWFAQHARPLPWRAPDTTPWGVLVSEIMSQQTPVARVAPRWLAFMERWPTPADLAAASTAEVLVAWDRLGYPRRAVRLQQAAAAIVDQHAGEVPGDEAALRALPGIGDYTAAAVAAFAFGRHAVVLDVNIRRVLARLFAGVAGPAGGLTKGERAAAEALVPTADHVPWNAGLMELGALVCTARNPACGACPVAQWCAWRAAGYPATAVQRTTQAWHGTDRQLRGAIMDVLKAASATAPLKAGVRADLLSAPEVELDVAEFDKLEPAVASKVSRVRELTADALRVEQLISALVNDGLAKRVHDRISLPH